MRYGLVIWQKLDRYLSFLPRVTCHPDRSLVISSELKENSSWLDTVHIGILLLSRRHPARCDRPRPGPVSRAQCAKLHMIWKTLAIPCGPIPDSRSCRRPPSPTARTLDVICVPGGGGQVALMTDEETLDFLRRQATTARYVTSVCTGSLVLGAAGLLKGYKSACHWAWRDMLPAFGAIPRGRARGARPQPHLGRRRHRRHRLRPHGRGRAGGRGSGQVDPARPGIRPAAAVRFGQPREGGVERVKRIRERLSGMLETRSKANAEAAARLA